MENFKWLLLFFIYGYCKADNATCHYKGAEYLEGDTILIEEPCLSCTCQQSSLKCSLRVCPKLPDPPPKGCIIIQHKHNCCPILQCEDSSISHNEVNIEIEKKPNDRSCLINGTLYAEGSAMLSSSFCEFCYCINGQQRCIQPSCATPQPNCLAIYKDHSCCPTKYNCSTSGEEEAMHHRARIPGCYINGTSYYDGDVVASDRPCDTCFCKNDEVVCMPVRCTIQHVEGCYPIYTQDRCCPMAYNCSTSRMEDVRSLKTEEDEVLTTLSPEEVTTTTEITTQQMTTEQVVNNPETTIIENEEETTQIFTSTEFVTETTVPTTSSVTEEVTTWLPESTTQTPTEVIITAKPELHILGLASKLLLDTGNRTQDEINLIQRAQPLEIEDILSSESNTTRPSEDYDSYDYSEPKLPPSLPNLVIFPFVAADAVTKEKSTPNNESIDKMDHLTSSDYFNNLFSPPVETEGGFVPKDDPIPETVTYIDTFYNKVTPLIDIAEMTAPSITTPPTMKSENCSWEGKLFLHGQSTSAPEDCTSCVCHHGEVICEEKLCATPPLGCTTEKEEASCCPRIICGTQETLTTIQPIDITESISNISSIEVSITTEENEVTSTDASLQMDDILPFILEQETTKPVSVNYKNTVVSYYPKHQITTTHDEEKKTTMVFQETPIIISSTESYKETINNNSISPVYFQNNTSLSTTEIPEENTTLKSILGIKQKVTKLPTTESDSFLDEFLKGFFENEGTSTTLPPPKLHQKYSSKIRNPIIIPSTTQHSIDVIQTREGEEVKTDSLSLNRVFSMLFNAENLESTTIRLGNKTKHTNVKFTRKPAIRRTKKPTTVLLSTTEIPKLNVTETTIKSTYVTEQGTGFPKINILKQEKKDKKTVVKNSVGIEKQPESLRKPTLIPADLGGILKLAGCNIYGRMYRIGKIITELTNPCLKCMCTESGVQCSKVVC